MRLFEIAEPALDTSSEKVADIRSKAPSLSNPDDAKQPSSYKPLVAKGFDKSNPLHLWWWRNFGKQKSKVEKGKRGGGWEGEKWGIDADFAWYILNDVQKWRCAITGVEFKDDKYWRPALDRINSSKGYVRGNLQFLAASVNNAKWDMTEDQFRFMCSKVCNPENKS